MHKTQSALDELSRAQSAHTKPRNLAVRQKGDEPLPGYRLLDLLGRGGFGEVWRCEVPGGLFKAVKFVERHQEQPREHGSLADQEFRALERIKLIRHPYLLSIERVELVEDLLIVVMELADQSLYKILLDIQAAGKRGLPRDQVLGYMLEAAEVLDLLHFEHGLQHLDIKPHNLFLVSQHVKVADFGLVNSFLDPTKTALEQGGGTPLYSSPERLQGKVSLQSDQYSLAITFQQLVTGTLPFFSYNTYELMNLHIKEQPDLSPLSPEDQVVIAKALHKNPEQRYSSCVEFVLALDGAQAIRPGYRRGPSESVADMRDRLSRTRNLLEEAQRNRGNSQTSLIPPSDDDQAGPAPDRTVTSMPAKEKKEPNLPRLSLPGYEFLQMLGANRLCEVWTVKDPGEQERLAHCLLIQSDRDSTIQERLQGLRHRGLANADVYLSPAGRLIVLTDLELQPLRAKFETCRSGGERGIPREELLDYLTEVAETLDSLRESQELLHLGLNPTNIVLSAERALLRDFGLLHLAWVPTGLPAAQINARYAAPELHASEYTETSDQYSLALIYAEMLTGIVPRAQRSSGRSGIHRRSGAKQPKPPQSNSTTASGNRSAPARIDLEVVPVFDRDVLERATSFDPKQRFASCSEMVEALRNAPDEHRKRMDRQNSLLPVVPVTVLMSQETVSRIEVPSMCHLVNDTLSDLAGVVTICNEDIRYHLQRRGRWSCRFPVHLFADALRLRLQGFCQEWAAEFVGQRKPGSYVLRIMSPDTPRKTGIPGFRKTQPEGLEVHITAIFAVGQTNTRIGELIVQLLPFGGKDGQAPTSVLKVGPKVVETLRSYLQPGSEQRDQARWPLAQNLRVFPIHPGRTDFSMIPGKGKDLSLSGLGFYVEEHPNTDRIYVHLYETECLEHLALEANIMRVRQTEDDCIEIGAAFALDDKDLSALEGKRE